MSETIERVVPGSGRVAVTTRIVDLAPGEWKVTATVVTPNDPLVTAAASAVGATGFAPLTRARARLYSSAETRPRVAITSGAVFVTAVAASTFARQLVLPRRDLPRRTSHGRILVLAITTAIVLADLAVAVLTLNRARARVVVSAMATYQPRGRSDRDGPPQQ